VAVAAIALTLAAAAGTAIAVAKFKRLKADYRVIEAGERFEAVDLTTIVKRYVPSERQTQKASEELPIAKQVIGSRRPRCKRTAIIAAVLMLCGAAAVTLSVQRILASLTTAQLAAKPPLNLDLLTAIQGVWGWRADVRQSCAVNPQTISVTPDRKTLTVQYAKPVQPDADTSTTMNFDVVSATSNLIVLRRPDSTNMYLRFIDADTITVSRSDEPVDTSGAVERCVRERVRTW
jgi:hypothetical protein